MELGAEGLPGDLVDPLVHRITRRHGATVGRSVVGRQPPDSFGP
jgi:hypothetical protein